jgi:hypothetical protein
LFLQPYQYSTHSSANRTVTKAFTRQDVLKHHVTNPCNDRRVRLTKHANYCALLMPILRRTRQLSAPQYLMISRCVFLSCKRGTLKAFGPTQVTDAQGQCCPRCKSNAHVTYIQRLSHPQNLGFQCVNLVVDLRCECRNPKCPEYKKVLADKLASAKSKPQDDDTKRLL